MIWGRPMRILFPRFGRATDLSDSTLCSFFLFLFLAVIATPALAADVQGSIQAGRSAAYGGGVRSAAGSAASRSAGETAGINKDSIHSMPDHAPLKDGTTTDDKIRFDNEYDRIQNKIKENRQKELKSREKIVTTGIKG